VNILKKGILLMISAYFLIAAPSLTQAEEIGRSGLSLNILTKSQSLISTITNEVVSTVNGVVTQLPIVSETPVDEVIKSNDPASVQESVTPTAPPSNLPGPVNPPNSGDEVCDIKPPLSNNKGALKIETSLPAVGNVDLDLLSKNTGVLESGDQSSAQTQLLGLELNDSLLLGNVSAKVLSSQKAVLNDGQVISDSLASITLNNLLGDIAIGAVESNTIVSKDTSYTSGGLLFTDLTGSLLGDTHLGLGVVNEMVSPNEKGLFSGLISIDINHSLIGDAHIGVLGNHKTETGDGGSSSWWLIVIDLKDFLLGNTEIVVGDYEHGYNNRPPPDSMVGDDDSDSISEGRDRPSESNTGKDEPVSDSIIDSTEHPTELMIERLKVDRYAEAKFIDMLFDFANKNSAYQFKKNDSTDSINIINSTNENSVKLSIAAEPSTVPTTSSGSSSAGSSSSSGGSGIAAYLHSTSVNNASLNDQLQSDYKDLSNQWIDAPQIGPPQTSFFLSNI
jgi:hypothetical protein